MITVANIKRVVADHYGVTLDELSGESRFRRVTGPRQVAMTLAWRLTDHSKARIASFFDKCPNTAFCAVSRVEQRQETRGDIRNDLRKLTLELVRG